VGCGQNDNSGNLPVIDVVGNLGTYRQMTMSELIEEVEYIPLETALNFMVGRTDHLIVTDSRIYIGGFDHLYAFTREGKFVSDVGRKGRGPGEWDYYAEVSVDEKKQAVYVNTYDKIFEYAQDGKFSRDFEKLKFQRGDENRVPNPFVSIRDGLFLGYLNNNTGDEPYNWIIFDSAGTVVKQFDNHIKLNKEPFSSRVFYSAIAYTDGAVWVKEGINDTIFNISRKGELVPSFVFDFGKYAFPLDAMITFQSISELASKAVTVTSWPFWPMVVSRDHIFFITKVGKNTGIPTPPGNSTKMYVMGNEVEISDSGDVLGMYNIALGTTRFLDRDSFSRLLGFVNDIDGGLSFWPQYYNDSENELVQVLEAYKMKDLLTDKYFAAHPAKDPAAHERLRELLRNLNENSNPVIVIAKLKK
jgi:hypothetical protein